MKLSPAEKGKFVSCCNDNLISYDGFDPDREYPIDWFKRQFSFVQDQKVREHLADEFYQTRFAYTLMQTLSLPMAKNKGIVKFQIIQYASICEALLNYALETYFKEEFESRYAATTYVDFPSALSINTKITFEGKPLYLCKGKTEKAKITWTANPTKATFALEKGVLSQDTKDKYCALYDLRNNAHILKAATADYYPKLKEASAGYELVFHFIAEIRAFFEANPVDN